MAREYFVTTPIVSEVRGRVIEVPVEPNRPLKRGDVLYEIDPEPFETKIEGLEGRLVSARKQLKRSENLYKGG
ncbi:MAG: biotin/lipoyl-binding protein, partial [Burkholderiales bacterium]|nr:biotin/lipoyl-binding protein [Burkholderiales bacterium]